MRHAHPIDLREDVVWQVRFGIEPHHLSRPRQMGVASEAHSQPGLRIGRREPPLNVEREERSFFVRAEKTNSVQIASALVAADEAQEVFPTHAVRQRPRRDRGDAPERARTVAIECDDTGMRDVPIVPAKKLVAAVSRQHHRDVPPRHL